jgi:hypothetical protein
MEGLTRNAPLAHLAALRHDLWLARPGEIAAHALSLPKGTLP